MRKKTKIVIVSILTITVALVAIFYCMMTNDLRDFKEDIIIDIPNLEASLIIREWKFLLGSGAEVYYKPTNGKAFMLGTAGGGDDGYTPFADGEYTVKFQENGVNISWYFGVGNHWNSCTLYYIK